MNDDRDVARALRDAVPIPEVPTSLLVGAQRRRESRRRGVLTAGGALAVAPALLALPEILRASHGLAVARWHALFQARGPPSVH